MINIGMISILLMHSVLMMTPYYTQPINNSKVTNEWVGNSHNRESFLNVTPFNITIDGEELHLWYDQNSMVYFDEECTEPFIAPSGNPYLYINLDGVVGFAEFYNEGELDK